MRIAVILINYNMPEATDKICDYIRAHVNYSHDLIIVDNGSDLIAPSKYTTLFLPKNIQTCRGWLAGLAYADILEMSLGEPYFAYLIVGTSIELLLDSDHISVMANFMLADENVVGIAPAVANSDIKGWMQIIDRGTGGPRRTWGLDHLFTMWRADWFNSVGRFDPDLVYAWGLAEETCWQARRDGKSMWVHEGLKMIKHHDIGYTLNRMNMSAKERCQNAMKNVTEVLLRKHGKDWMRKLSTEFVDESWR